MGLVDACVPAGTWGVAMKFAKDKLAEGEESGKRLLHLKACGE